MAKGEEITTRFRVDISDLKSGIAEANQQIKLANAEFKAATAGMDDWSKSADGIKAKLSQLDSVLSAQKSKLEAYTEQLSRQQKAYDENGRRAAELRSKLEELANNGVAKTSKEYKEYENALAACEKEQESNRKAVDSLRITVLDQQAAVNKTEAEIGRYNSTLDDLEGAAGEADQASDELADSLKDAGDAADDASGGFTVMKGVLADLVADGIRTAIGALKDFVKESIEVGKNFDASMSNVAALSGATGDELQMLRDTAKEFGASTQFSASQAADALGYMALAGWDAEQSASALGGVLDLAAASGMGLAEASDMVTDYMSAFNMEADQSSYFADMLAYAQANANTTAQGLGEAFKNCAANMNAAGQDIETTVSLLSMMANQGMKGSTAGTALSAVMRDLTKKMDDGNIAIGDTMVSVMDANGNFRDLTAILRDVENATNGMGDAEKAAALSSTFTADSIKGLNLILNAGVEAADDFETQLRMAGGVTSMTSEMVTGMADEMLWNWDRLGHDTEAFSKEMQDYLHWEYELSDDAAEEVIARFIEQVQNGSVSAEELAASFADVGGSASAMAQVMNDNLSGDLTSLGSKFEGVQITLYEKLEPALRSGVDALSDLLDVALEVIDEGAEFIEWLNSGSLGAEALKTVIVALVGAFGGFMAVQSVIALIDGMKTAFAALNAVMAANPIGLVVAAIAALVAAFLYLWNNCEEFREFWINLWDNIKEIAEKVWKAIKEVFTKAWDGIKNAFSKTKEFFKEKFESARDAVKNAWNKAGNWFSEKKDQIQNAFSKVDSWMGDKFGGAWEAVKLKWKASVDWFKNIWESIKAIFAVVKDVLSGNFQDAWDKIKGIVDLWKGYFKGIWDGIKSIFKPVGDFFEETFNKAKDAVKGPINFIIRGLNKLISGVNKISFDVPDWVPVIGGQKWGFNIPEIPELARGGILRREQTGFLEGNGAEAVIPLERNKFWIHSVASDLLRQIKLSSGGGVTNIGGAKDYNFTQIINAPEAPSRIEIYRQTRNLLSYAKAAAGGA